MTVYSPAEWLDTAVMSPIQFSRLRELFNVHQPQPSTEIIKIAVQLRCNCRLISFSVYLCIIFCVTPFKKPYGILPHLTGQQLKSLQREFMTEVVSQAFQHAYLHIGTHINNIAVLIASVDAP